MKLIATIALCLFCYSADSTCIAIYVHKNVFYVVSDSKRIISGNKNGKNFSATQSISKIHNVGKVYCAISGADDGSLLKYSTIELKNNSDVTIAMSKFGSDMVKVYKALLPIIKQDNQFYYNFFLRNGLSKVCFFGYVNNMAFLYIVEIAFTETNTGLNVNYTIEPARNVFTAIGVTDGMDSMQDKDFPTTAQIQRQPELFPESLVKYEIKKHPKLVGYPIEILKLTPSGPVWIKKNNKAVAY